MIPRFAAGVLAALAVVGCGGPTKTEAGTAAPATDAPARAATTDAVTAAAGATPDRSFVVGKWGTDGDCTMAMDLRADGTTDGPFGDWTYTDGVISFAEAPELKITVTKVDDATMTSTNPDGETATMTRCP